MWRWGTGSLVKMSEDLHLYIKIPTQLTNQSRIKAADTITTVFVKVGSGDIKVFADFIFTNTLFFQLIHLSADVNSHNP